jgi:hypothetical protein
MKQMDERFSRLRRDIFENPSLHCVDLVPRVDDAVVVGVVVVGVQQLLAGAQGLPHGQTRMNSRPVFLLADENFNQLPEKVVHWRGGHGVAEWSRVRVMA